MRSLAVLASAAVVAAVLAAAAHAADPKAPANLCARIEDDRERLTCYDTSFGRGVASAPLPAGVQPYTPVGPAPLPDSFDSSVKSLQRRANGLWAVTLEDDQVWVQTDSADDLSVKAGDKVRVRKGMLGSWFLQKIGSNRTMRVRPMH